MSPDFSTLNLQLSTFNLKTLANNKLTILRRDNFVKVLTIIEVRKTGFQARGVIHKLEACATTVVA